MKRTKPRLLSLILAVFMIATLLIYATPVAYADSIGTAAPSVTSVDGGETDETDNAPFATLATTGAADALAVAPFSAFVSGDLTIVMNTGTTLQAAVVAALQGGNPANVTKLIFTGAGTNIMSNVTDRGYLQNTLTQVTELDLSGFSGSFAPSAFDNCGSIETVRLAAGTNIPVHMFYRCASLVTVYTGNTPANNVADLSGVTGSFGDACFRGTGVQTVHLPVNAAISNNMFMDCASLDTIYTGAVPANGVIDLSSVKSFGQEAFQNCTSITTVRMPPSADIPFFMFNSCTNLDAVWFDKTAGQTITVGLGAFAGIKSGATGYVPSGISWGGTGAGDMRNQNWMTLDYYSAITGLSASPATFTSTGGTSTVTVTGTGLTADVKVAIFNGANIVSGSETALGNITGATHGTVSLTFPANTAAGGKTYTVKASVDNGITWESTSASVKVAGDDTLKVNADKDSLTFDAIKNTNTAQNNITDKLNLVTKGSIYASTITWSSTPSGYIANNGALTKPAYGTGDKTVTLTATITNGTASATIPFTLTVKEASETDAQKAAEDKAALTFDVIKNTNTAQNNITDKLNLITKGIVRGSTITWSSTPSGYIAGSGMITRPAYGMGDQPVTLTATIDCNGTKDTVSFVLTVKQAPESDAQKVADDMAGLTFNNIKGNNTAATNITDDLILPSSGSSGSTITWSSVPAGYIDDSNGTILKHPSFAEGDRVVTLTATVTSGAVTQTKDFYLTLVIGGVVINPVAGGNGPAATLSGTTADLRDAVLTDEDINAIVNDDASFTVSFAVQEQDASPADKQVIEGNRGSNAIGMYLDISMFKQKNGGTSSAVRQLNKPVRIEFGIPDALKRPRRSFSMISVHNGNATVHPNLSSDPGNKILIEADSFSAYAIVYNDSGQPSGSGGSSGSESAVTTAGTYWIELSDATSMAKAAKEKGLDYARSTFTKTTGIREAALKALLGLRYEHDTVDNGEVQVRVYIDDPSKATKDILVSGYVKGDAVDTTKTSFNKWFTNKLVIISMEQRGSFGINTRIAAKTNLSGMNTKNLYFYSYDKKTNECIRIQTAYKFDINGYLHFASALAGDIIVSDGSLTERN